jgi:hypothetical protein
MATSAGRMRALRERARRGPLGQGPSSKTSIYRKGVVAPSGQPYREPLGVWLTLQIQEADNRLVKGCHAFVYRTQQGRGPFAYGVAKDELRALNSIFRSGRAKQMKLVRSCCPVAAVL